MNVEINATNFPDDTFRAYVSVYDSNSDDVLSDSDIANIVALDLVGVNSLVGLEFLTSVKTCSLRYPGTSISITSQSLEDFEIQTAGNDSTIVNLSFINCPRLISIKIPWQYVLETITISDCPSLEWLDAYGPMELTTVSLNNCSNLRGINLWGASKVTNLNVSNFKKLEVLRFDHAYLSNLNVVGCSKLKYLIASNNYDSEDSGTTLDLTGCEAIRCVKFNGHRNLTTVKLPSHAPDLHTLDIGRGAGVLLNISGSPLLVNLVQNQSNPSRVNWGGGSPNAFRYGPSTNPAASEQGVDTYPLTNEARSFSNTDLSLTYPINGTIVYLPISIIQQPVDVHIEPESDGGYFTIVANGSDLEYTWEIKLQGNETWVQFENSGNSEQFYVANESGNNGAKVRCRVHNSSASIYSDEAQFIILAAPIIITQPSSVSVSQGDTVTIALEAFGYDISYEWQVSVDDGETWEINTMFTSNTYQVLATLDTDGYRFRCRVYNSLGEVYSNAAILTVSSESRTTTPSLLSLIEGQNGSFSIESNTKDKSYQWQVSTDGGTTWNDIRYAVDAIYEIIASLTMTGYKYRCAIHFPGNEIIYSSSSSLTVTADPSLIPPTITTHPSSQETADGNNVTLSVVASGSNLSYQWQTLRNDTWYSINGATSSSYTTLASLALSGTKYRCQVSNAAGGVYSNTATLTVTSSGSSISTPTISAQPRSANVNDGQTAIFSLTADGGGLSYQWYIKRNGQWYPISGATNAIYSVIGRSANNGTQYRCLVTNSAGSVYSNVVTLSVQSAAPLSFYGYHSIIISGKNTYGEWEMYPTSRPHVAPPEVKTSYVDVPGADGGLDYTDLLTGEPRFGYRKGSWEFLLIPQERWPDVYRSLCNFLNGRVHTVVLEDDPTWQYTGRLSVNKWESAAHNSLITIDYILDPNPVNLDDESYSTDDDDLAAAARILRKPGNDGMAIGMFNGSATVVDPATYFEDGDNISY